MNNYLTLTVVAQMTANYGEGLGNISSVQKVFRNGRVYAVRSRESLKNALMVQSGFYDDLVVSVDGATQKDVNDQMNASNCRALEGGYMNTTGITNIRNSSFYLTDAVACQEFVNETRFHNNLYMASTFARQEGLNLQEKAGECGLMPYQYEYDKSLKQYSITIDLTMIGKDDNFGQEATNEEKANRVVALLEAVANLNLVVKGNLDNAEPILIVGGLSPRKTHYFENVVQVKQGKLTITSDLEDRLAQDHFAIGLLEGDNFANEAEIIKRLKPSSVTTFFNDLKKQVQDYYGV